MERIGFGPRLGAALIDVSILQIVMFPFLIISTFFMSSGSLEDLVMSVGFVIMLILSFAYTTLEIFKAATPGKMLLKLKIKAEDGNEASKGALVKRWAFKNIPSICVGLCLIFNGLALSYPSFVSFNIIDFFLGISQIVLLVVFVGCFFTLAEARQAFHDKFAKTAVFKVSA